MPKGAVTTTTHQGPWGRICIWEQGLYESNEDGGCAATPGERVFDVLAIVPAAGRRGPACAHCAVCVAQMKNPFTCCRRGGRGRGEVAETHGVGRTTTREVEGRSRESGLLGDGVGSLLLGIGAWAERPLSFVICLCREFITALSQTQLKATSGPQPRFT